MTDTMAGYIACWNETDATARRTLLEQHWTPDATYVDPMADVAGLDELTTLIGGVHEQFPGFVFTALGTVGGADAHHDQQRFRWGLGPAGAEPVVEGFDVVTTAADGRIRQVIGFLDVVPG